MLMNIFRMASFNDLNNKLITIILSKEFHKAFKKYSSELGFKYIE